MAEYIEWKALDKALTAAAAHDKDKNRRTWAKAICILHDLPAADVAPVRHGDWEIVLGSNGNEYMVCTCCRVSKDLTGVFTYCPNCGARMDGDSDAKAD